MIKSIREQLGGLLEAWDTEAGKHTIAWLPPHVEDTRVAAEAAKAGLNVAAVSQFALRPISRGGLLLGYAAFTPDAIRKGLRDLEIVIKKCARASGRKANSAD